MKKEIQNANFYHGIHIYKGSEFPDLKGKIIHVWDDHTNPEAPCYMIQVVWSNEEIMNIDGEDIKFVNEDDQCDICNGYGFTDAAHNSCFNCKGAGLKNNQL